MVPLAVLPKYTDPSWLDVRFSAWTPVSLIVTSVRLCARRGDAIAVATMAVENALAGLRGERLPNCVNPEVYRR